MAGRPVRALPACSLPPSVGPFTAVSRERRETARGRFVSDGSMACAQPEPRSRRRCLHHYSPRPRLLLTWVEGQFSTESKRSPSARSGSVDWQPETSMAARAAAAIVVLCLAIDVLPDLWGRCASSPRGGRLQPSFHPTSRAPRGVFAPRLVAEAAAPAQHSGMLERFETGDVHEEGASQSRSAALQIDPTARKDCRSRLRRPPRDEPGVCLT